MHSYTSKCRKLGTSSPDISHSKDKQLTVITRTSLISSFPSLIFSVVPTTVSDTLLMSRSCTTHSHAEQFTPHNNHNLNTVPSVLWHCWLGVRKSIRPVKIEWWGVGMVICLLYMVQLMPLHPKILSSLASFKSRLVLSFLYRLTQVVLEKRPLNGCSSSSSY